MSTKTVHAQSIQEVHAQLIAWEQQLGFYRDEMKVFENRLAEVVQANTDHALLAKAEHFQNLFIVQREQLDRLEHEIRLKKELIGQMATSHAFQALRVNNTELGNQVTAAEKILQEIKQQFYRFVGAAL